MDSECGWLGYGTRWSMRLGGKGQGKRLHNAFGELGYTGEERFCGGKLGGRCKLCVKIGSEGGKWALN